MVCIFGIQNALERSHPLDKGASGIRFIPTDEAYVEPVYLVVGSRDRYVSVHVPAGNRYRATQAHDRHGHGSKTLLVVHMCQRLLVRPHLDGSDTAFALGYRILCEMVRHHPVHRFVIQSLPKRIDHDLARRVDTAMDRPHSVGYRCPEVMDRAVAFRKFEHLGVLPRPRRDRHADVDDRAVTAAGDEAVPDPLVLRMGYRMP